MTNHAKPLLVRIAWGLTGALIVHLGLGRYHGWIDLTLSVLVSAALYVLVDWLLARHDVKLTNRMGAVDEGEWEVRLNGIKLGTVTDNDYAAMQRAVFRDGRVALAQTLNVGVATLVVLGKLMFVTPIMAFWLVVGTALIAPDYYTHLVRELQQVDPLAFAAAVKRYLELFVMAPVCAIGVMAALGRRFGFRNCYCESVNRFVRQRFNTPAEGDITFDRMMRGEG
jgi:hypothetical protein